MKKNVIVKTKKTPQRKPNKVLTPEEMLLKGVTGKHYKEPEKSFKEKLENIINK